MVRKYPHGITLILIALMVFLPGFIYAENLSTNQYLWTEVNDNDDSVFYEGLWLAKRNPLAQGGTESLGFRENSYVEFPFNGTAIRWIGSTGMGRGLADVYLNGELISERLDTFSSETQNQQVIFEFVDLEPQLNTLRIVPNGVHSEEAYMAHIGIEGFAFIPSLEESIRNAKQVVSEANPPQLGEYLSPYYTENDIPKLIGTLAHAETQIEKEKLDYELRDSLLFDLKKYSEEINKRDPVLLDNSSHENHAVVGGGPLWSNDKLANFVQFNDSTSQYVHSIKTGSLDGVSQAEMEIEIYIDSDFWNSQHGVVAGIHDGSGSTSNQQFTFTRHSNNTMQFRMNSTGRHEVNTVMSPGEYDDEWITLRAKFNSGQLTVYVNEELKFEYAANATTFFELNQPFYLSSASSNYEIGSRGFIGKIRKAVLKVEGEDVLNWTFDSLVKERL